MSIKKCKIMGPKNVSTIFGVKQIWGANNFRVQQFQVQRNLGQKKLGPKKFRSKKCGLNDHGSKKLRGEYVTLFPNVAFGKSCLF